MRHPLLEAIASAQRLSPSTREHYVRCVSRFLGFSRGSESPMTVEAWRDSLLASGLAPQTVNKHIYALRGATRRAQTLGSVSADFAAGAETARTVAPTAREAMTMEEVSALMRTCEEDTPADIRDRAILRIALVTGLRADNLRSLTAESIEGRRLHVVQKRQRLHSPVLDDASLSALRRWRGWLGRRGIAQGPLWWQLRDTLEGWELVAPIRSRFWLNQMIAARAKAAGIGRPIHPHLFRHTCVSWLLAAGVPPQRVMLQTGHESLQTLSGYVTDLEAESRPVADYLPEF